MILTSASLMIWIPWYHQNIHCWWPSPIAIDSNGNGNYIVVSEDLSTLTLLLCMVMPSFNSFVKIFLIMNTNGYATNSKIYATRYLFKDLHGQLKVSLALQTFCSSLLVTKLHSQSIQYLIHRWFPHIITYDICSNFASHLCTLHILSTSIKYMFIPNNSNKHLNTGFLHWKLKILYSFIQSC